MDNASFLSPWTGFDFVCWRASPQKIVHEPNRRSLIPKYHVMFMSDINLQLQSVPRSWKKDSISWPDFISSNLNALQRVTETENKLFSFCFLFFFSFFDIRLTCKFYLNFEQSFLNQLILKNTSTNLSCRFSSLLLSFNFSRADDKFWGSQNTSIFIQKRKRKKKVLVYKFKISPRRHNSLFFSL